MEWKPAQRNLRLSRRSPIYRILRYLLFLTIAWTIIDVLYVHHALNKEHPEPPELGDEKIFIASIHWNTGLIVWTHWLAAVLDVAKEIGKDKVFVSIQESGSWDDTKGGLRLLESMLKADEIPNKLILDPTTHADEISRNPADSGWIMTPRGHMELRRVPYLAGLRNLVMEPFYELAKQGQKFDKILFLNDVAFSPLDVRELLATRGGDYAAACSLDFRHPPYFYDTMALRDSEGHDFLMQTWPFFRSRRSRRAVKTNNPVPVQSCWNGMVIMDAEPFYEDELKFRGIPDSLGEKHLEGSECCLIHADNPLSEEKGVWLNPRVRVAYDGQAYNAVNDEPPWSSTWTILSSSWTNRILRWATTPWFKNQIVERRLRRWKAEDPEHQEDGKFCLINEMQVLVSNGWAHV